MSEPSGSPEDAGALDALLQEVNTLKAELAAARQSIVALESAPIPESAEDPIVSVLAASGVGSIFEKAAHGWTVKYVDGGTVITVQGDTIVAAIESHGLQVVHPKSREQLVRESVDVAAVV